MQKEKEIQEKKEFYEKLKDSVKPKIEELQKKHKNIKFEFCDFENKNKYDIQEMKKNVIFMNLHPNMFMAEWKGNLN